MKPPVPVGAILIDVAVVVLVARLVGRLFRRMGQPAVVGEILAGILLGPSVLNHIVHGSTDRLFPRDVVRYLEALAALGLVLYMFVIGLDLDIALIRGKEKIAGAISVASIATPFVLGVLLATWLFGRHTTGKSFIAFALFVGAAMSITAFPVLARILADRGMHRTELGGLALASAAVDDILAWSLLAVVVVVAGSGDKSWHAALAVPYLALMFLVVRPLLRRLVVLYDRAGRLTPDVLAVVLIGALLSAWATDWLGIHYIFGAFLFGAVMPRKQAGKMLEQIVERLEQVSVLLLLPVFFVVTGLKVDLRLTGSQLGELGLILVVAIGGKFVGAFVGARSQGIRPRRAGALAVLANTRGLTELVILTVGLEKGIIDNSLFALMVVMAVVTTVMTGPLLRVVYPDRWIERDVAEAERRALGISDAYRVLVAVDDPSTAEPLVDLAVDLVSGEQPAEVVLTTVRGYRTSTLEVGSGLRGELADMAATATALDELSARCRRRDVPCTVLTRFGTDIVGELALQALAVDADVILLGGFGSVAHQVLERMTCQVVVAAGIALLPSTLAVASGSGADGDAALEVALRLAIAGEARLILLDDGHRRRRLSGLAEQLSHHGVPASVEAWSPQNATVAGALVVSAVSSPSRWDAPMLAVRAERDREPADWPQLIQRIDRQAPAPH